MFLKKFAKLAIKIGGLIVLPLLLVEVLMISIHICSWAVMSTIPTGFPRLLSHGSGAHGRRRAPRGMRTSRPRSQQVTHLDLLD